MFFIYRVSRQILEPDVIYISTNVPNRVSSNGRIEFDTVLWTNVYTPVATLKVEKMATYTRIILTYWLNINY